jgi:phosphatidylglycerol:prolipoprotein diacylglycerol transferase
MIPYFTLPVWQLGGVPVDPWGLLVCGGFVLGLEIARARGIRLGLDVRDIVDGSVFIVLMGFLGGHLVHVLAYHPDTFARDGVMSLVRVWEGFASTGGFLGAVTGAVLFFRVIRPRPFWAHADTVMFGFPFAWIFGRAGCFVVHDHIGAPTGFPLAVAFPGGARHDLGLYETLLAVAIAGLFLVLARRPRVAGFYTTVWCLVYAPARFGFDFLRNTDLRNADVRWQGLTPAQYGMMLMFTAGLVLALRWKTLAGGVAGGGQPPAEEGPSETASPA